MTALSSGMTGPPHLNLAKSNPVIRSLKKHRGKPGPGAGAELQIEAGLITSFSIGQTANGKCKFVVAEAESARRPIPPTGNTNTHGVFVPSVRTFLKRWVAEGPLHHLALGIGRRATELVETARIPDFEYALQPPRAFA